MQVLRFYVFPAPCIIHHTFKSTTTTDSSPTTQASCPVGSRETSTACTLFRCHHPSWTSKVRIRDTGNEESGSGVESLSLILLLFHKSFLLTPGVFPMKTKKYLHRHPVDSWLEYTYFMKIGQPKPSERVKEEGWSQHLQLWRIPLRKSYWFAFERVRAKIEGG